MLDRTKILNELSTHLKTFSTHYNSDYVVAKGFWQVVAHDEALQATLAEHKTQLALPTWQGAPGTIHTINPMGVYDTIAIDGSQIYPDRHEGISCFVINIGTVYFHYTATTSTVECTSTPYLLSSEAGTEFENKQETVNAMRTEREFMYGLELMRQKPTGIPRLLMVDGSLIFWHLQVTQTEAKQQFLGRYIKLLDQYYQHKQLFAGFISLPQSRELINIIRAFGQMQSGELIQLASLVDADIAALFLQPQQRSILFRNHSSVTEQYPEHSKPYFFYYNTGNEIARIEIPAWIALNQEYLSTIESIIADQCNKGFGYPIALAESHEQAVVSAADRDFFYQMIQSMLNSNTPRSSQKLMKKKKMPI